MLKETCPGSREIKNPYPEEIKNPYPEEIKCIVCGGTTEIWTDEPETACKTCGGTVSRDMRMTCIKWCPAAKECVGAEKYERLIKALKD